MRHNKRLRPKSADSNKLKIDRTNHSNSRQPAAPHAGTTTQQQQGANAFSPAVISQKTLETGAPRRPNPPKYREQQQGKRIIQACNLQASDRGQRTADGHSHATPIDSASSTTFRKIQSRAIPFTDGDAGTKNRSHGNSEYGVPARLRNDRVANRAPPQLNKRQPRTIPYSNKQWIHSGTTSPREIQSQTPKFSLPE